MESCSLAAIAAIAAAASRSEAAAALAHAASLWKTLALALGLIAVAFLLNRFNPAKRVHVKRAVILFFLHVLVLGLAKAFLAAGSVTWAGRIQAVANLLAAFVLVSLIAVLIFDLVLKLLRVRATEIVVDLSVGAGYLIAVGATLSSLGVDASGLVATSAVVTGIVGLSLQKTLGNILGGVALQLDDSIRVGDWIQIGEGPQGRVTEIHWRHTVVETRNWDTLIIPNATLLDSTITILGKRGGASVPHRMWIYFAADFRHAPNLVIQAVNEALQAAPIPNVAQDPAPHCICFDFLRQGQQGMTCYAVRYFLTNLAADDPTSSVVRTRIDAALKRAGAGLAIPAEAVFITVDDEKHKERHAQREHRHRVECLAAVDIFRSMSPEELEKLAPRLRLAPFAAGETMTRQGAVAHWLYVMTAGTADVRLRGKEDREEVVAKLQAPTFFGEMALLTGEPRSSTVVATTDVECYRLDRDAFRQILEERPALAAEISAVVARRRVELDAALKHLDHEARERQVEEKTYQMLVRISEFFGLKDATAALPALSARYPASAFAGLAAKDRR